MPQARLFTNKMVSSDVATNPLNFRLKSSATLGRKKMFGQEGFAVTLSIGTEVKVYKTIFYTESENWMCEFDNWQRILFIN